MDIILKSKEVEKYSSYSTYKKFIKMKSQFSTSLSQILRHTSLWRKYYWSLYHLSQMSHRLNVHNYKPYFKKTFKLLTIQYLVKLTWYSLDCDIFCNLRVKYIIPKFNGIEYTFLDYRRVQGHSEENLTKQNWNPEYIISYSFVSKP